MTDYNHTDIGSGYNTKTAINTELGLVETAIATKLDKLSGQLGSDLDADSNNIINLADGTNVNDAATYGQLLSTVTSSSFTTADAKFVDTVALATADTSLTTGDVLILKDRADGIFDVITGTSTANAWNIIAHDTLDLSLSLRIDSETITTEARTWYVDPSLGSDTFGKGVASGASAFATIQYAYDQLPNIINHQQTIQLADGTYNTNYLSSTKSVAMPRPAILFGRGKHISPRTQKNGSEMEGGIVIKGNSTTPTNVIIQTTSTWTYGIYNAYGQLALQDFIIKGVGGGTAVNNLLTSHRGTSYVHALNVSLDGVAKADTAIGMLTEGGGIIEFTTTSTATIVNNCTILAQASSMGDNLSISGQLTLDGADEGISVSVGAKVNWTSGGLTGQYIQNCSNNVINVQNGGSVEVRGTDNSNHILLDGDVQVWNNASLELVWADITGATSVNSGSALKLNNSDYQGQILVEAAEVWFNGSDSFISPASANDSAKPVILRNDSRIYTEGTNSFNGSAGLSLHAKDVTEQTVSADATVITVADELTAVTRVNATTQDRSSCTLPAGLYQGQILHIYSTSAHFTQIVESTTATIATDSIKISGASVADEYQGVSFIWRTDRWVEFGRSGAGA